MRKLIPVVLMLCLAGSVFADGMGLKGLYRDRWDFVDEANQQAFINYENGVQKMIISVGFDARESGFVWLFPVPADPRDVNIDILKELPGIEGTDVSREAKYCLEGAREVIFSTQLCCGYFVLYRGLSGSSHSASEELGVTVYEHIEKEGIATEVITAEDADGLKRYLKGKGLAVGDKSIPVLDGYIGKKYAFVVSWVASPKEFDMEGFLKKNFENILGDKYKFTIHASRGFDRFQDFKSMVWSMHKKFPGLEKTEDYSAYFETKEGISAVKEIVSLVEKDPSLLVGEDDAEATAVFNQKGVFVSFPSEKIYFPLMPTSVYGEKVVPAEIRVLGHVTPNVFEGIGDYMETNYFIHGEMDSKGDISSFYGGAKDNLRYTRIEIAAPSNLLTEDLWIENKAPGWISSAIFVCEYPWLVTVIIFIIGSIIAGIAAGSIALGDLRGEWKILTVIGLYNLLTIIGVFFAALYFRDKEDARYNYFSIFLFIVLYSIIFTIIATLIINSLISLI